MMRRIYCLLLYAFSPLVWLRLIWRSRKQPEYLQHLGERWGYYGLDKGSKPLLWVHAVSVGETRAAEPLVKGLLARYPDYQVLLTCMTPTGRETGAVVFGNGVLQAYLPYDYPGAVRRFLRYFKPQLGVLMETEVWPNLLAACQRQGVPVMLVNGRLSERSAKGYQRIRGLARPAFAAFTGVAAQTMADAERLGQCGARDVVVCGNSKFDVVPPPEKLAEGKRWRDLLQGRPIWLAASTREGEEGLILSAYQALGLKKVLLVLVPRHPQRFDEVAALVSGAGLTMGRRSQGMPERECQVWLGDSMGEMASYYAMADLALIGGSLAPLGGQNLIEAAACGCPVMVGPHMFNFAQATRDSLAAGAALQIEGASELAPLVSRLLSEDALLSQMALAARAFAAAHQGATARTMAFIASRWAPAAR